MEYKSKGLIHISVNMVQGSYQNTLMLYHMLNSPALYRVQIYSVNGTVLCPHIGPISLKFNAILLHDLSFLLYYVIII